MISPGFQGAAARALGRRRMTFRLVRTRPMSYGSLVPLNAENYIGRRWAS